jgi:GxxExxY protein
MDLCDRVVQAAVEVHSVLGPGLLEQVYELALCYELSLLGMSHQRQVPIPVIYKGIPVREPLYLDILVEGQIVVEVKSAERDNPYYQTQLLTHMKFLNVPKGLLINFGKESLQKGVCRLNNDSATTSLQR